MNGASESQVSRLCGELDERVGAFLNRQIEGDWPYVDRRRLREDARGRPRRGAGSILKTTHIHRLPRKDLTWETANPMTPPNASAARTTKVHHL